MRRAGRIKVTLLLGGALGLGVAAGWLARPFEEARDPERDARLQREWRAAWAKGEVSAPIAIEDASLARQNALCVKLVKCGHHSDVDGCVWQYPSWHSREARTLPLLRRAIAEGEVGYDPVEQAHVLARYVAGPCEEVGRRTTFVAHKRAGEACWTDDSCEGSLRCDGAFGRVKRFDAWLPTGHPGRCVRRQYAQLGDACGARSYPQFLENEYCDEVLTCDSDRHVCVPRAGLGAPCNPNNTLPCTHPFLCEVATGLCAKRRGRGERCTQDDLCGDGQRCFRNVCVDLPVEGEACVPAPDPDHHAYCAGPFYCGLDNICHRRGGLGAPCRSRGPYDGSASRECGGYVCKGVKQEGDVGRCAIRESEGGVCGRDDECAHPLKCGAQGRCFDPAFPTWLPAPARRAIERVAVMSGAAFE